MDKTKVNFELLKEERTELTFEQLEEEVNQRNILRNQIKKEG